MIEYLNENEGRAYPFVDSQKEGIPDSLITGLVLSGPRTFLSDSYLSSITKRGGLISVSISSTYGDLVVCTQFSPEQGIPYPLTPVAAGVGGFITFGNGFSDIEDLEKINVEVKLDPGTLRPSPAVGVSSINKFGLQDTAALRGLVNLEVGDNIILSYEDNVIRIGLQQAEARNFMAKCDRRAIFDECGDPPIRKISGVEPDGSGVVKLEFKNG